MKLITSEIEKKNEIGNRGKQTSEISKPRALRILKSTGIERVSSDAIEEFQEVVEEIMNLIVKTSHKYLKFENKTMLMPKHIEIALKDIIKKQE